MQMLYRVRVSACLFLTAIYNVKYLVPLADAVLDAFMSKLFRAVDDEKALEGGSDLSISSKLGLLFPVVKVTSC